MEENLSHKKCVPCEGGVEPMGIVDIEKYLLLIAPWNLEDGKLVRRFGFKDFQEAMVFLNQVADLAETEGHHPDMLLSSWNKVTLTLYTHAIGGLHMNDFVLASKINELTKTESAA